MSAPSTAPAAVAASPSSQRVAIVTGASRGIGAAIAKRLGAAGFAVIVNYVSNAAAAAETVDAIKRASGEATAVQADVGTAAGIEALFTAAEGTYGKVHTLVNNAGVLKMMTVKDTDDVWVDRTLDVNVKSIMYALRAAATRVVDGGRVINITSTVVATCPAGYGIYAASKAAVEALTRVASKELGVRGVTVNAVAPGAVSTDLFFAGKTADQVARIAAASPAGRIGEPDDIPGIVAFLAGPEAGWVNGQVIRVNGGVA